MLPKFYPFGRTEEDQVFRPNDDNSSGKVQISIFISSTSITSYKL